MLSIKELLAKKYVGDKLDNLEMLTLTEHLGKVAGLRGVMGERYHLAFADTNLMFIECFDYCKHRGLIASDSYYDVRGVTQAIQTENFLK